MLVLLHLFVVVNLLGPTTGDARSDIKQIQDEFWAWRMKEAPEFATFAGVNDYNSQLDVYKASRYEENKNYVSGLVIRLEGLKKLPSFGTMSQMDKINYEVLLDMLSSYVNGYHWHLYTIGNPVNFLEGPHQDIDIRFDVFPFKSFQDFFPFFLRMIALPQQIDDMIVLMRGSISRQRTNHNVSMEAVVGQLDKLISQGLQSPWYTKLEEKVNKSSLPAETKDWLLHNSGSPNIVTGKILPAYRRLRDFIVNEYMPQTRKGFGVSSFPEGAEFYQAALQWHISVDLTANQVHEKGLEEVARISKKMQQIMDRQNFTSSIQEYFNELSANPKFHVKTKEEGLRKFADIIYNRITPLLKKVFKNIPPNPVVIEPLTYDGPMGMYFDGSPDGSRPGVFKVNLQHPEIIQTYAMASLSLHETLPGHHLQGSYARTASLPAYRRTMDSNHYYRAPFHFPFYTAYVEGWGLYAEFLGEEMGAYHDDYELMGRYSMEMFRACRLVVDTGLHAKRWSKTKAMEYMLKYTSAARHEVEVEVNRYITWPGQACAYKIGELKIRELRDKATKRLGGSFDVRDFHSVILNAGPLPLRLLEKIVDDWIKKREASIILNPIG